MSEVSLTQAGGETHGVVPNAPLKDLQQLLTQLDDRLPRPDEMMAIVEAAASVSDPNLIADTASCLRLAFCLSRAGRSKLAARWYLAAFSDDELFEDDEYGVMDYAARRWCNTKLDTIMAKKSDAALLDLERVASALYECVRNQTAASDGRCLVMSDSAGTSGVDVGRGGAGNAHDCIEPAAKRPKADGARHNTTSKLSSTLAMQYQRWRYWSQRTKDGY